MQSDPVIQKFIADKEVSSASSSSSTAVLGNEENVMQHLIELLQQHNMNNQNKVVDEST